MGLKIVCHLSNRPPYAQDKFPSIEKAYRSVNTHTHTHTHTHTLQSLETDMIYQWWRQTEKYKQWSEYTFTPRKRKTQSLGRKTGNSGCGCPPETQGENPGPEPNKGRSSFYTGPTLGDAKTCSWLLRQALNFYFSTSFSWIKLIFYFGYHISLFP